MTCTDEAIKDGRWPIIGEQPFENVDDAWIPPQATFYVKQTNEWPMGSPYISHKGHEFKCDLEQVKGLDIASVVVHPEALVRLIIDRVINKNHEKYQVPK